MHRAHTFSPPAVATRPSAPAPGRRGAAPGVPASRPAAPATPDSGALRPRARAGELPRIRLIQSPGVCRLLPPLRSVSPAPAEAAAGRAPHPDRAPALPARRPPGPAPRGTSPGPGAAPPAAPAPASWPPPGTAGGWVAARGKAMGAAVQPQQLDDGGGAVAAAPELAAIAHQVEVLREDPVATAALMAWANQPAG